MWSAISVRSGSLLKEWSERTSARLSRARTTFAAEERFSGLRARSVAAIAAVALVTALMLPVRGSLGVLNVALIYLLLCFAVALALGASSAALVAVVSFVAFDFFFIPPYHTFSVASTDHVLALFVYLGVAIVTAQLVARVNARTEDAEREQRRTALLYDLNAALIGDVTLAAILATVVERVVHVYGAEGCRILLPDAEGVLVARAQYPPHAMASNAITREELAMATWVMERQVPAGLGTRRRVLRPHGNRPMPSPAARRPADVLYLPIATAKRVVGVMEVRGRPGGGRFDEDDERLLTSFANQAALAFERTRLVEEAGRAAALAQSDELKSALLAAVSHELRTPLATIKTATTALLDTAVDWDVKARDEFLWAIDAETDRLALMVSNLLDLSRIEGGVLRPDKEWYDAAELIADVAARLAQRESQHGHVVITEVESDLPLIRFDYVEIAQVLMNLGENALKYTPPRTSITIAARSVPGAVELAVRDTGPGIPPADLPHLFNKFYRAEMTGRMPGTGIGLAIAKGLVEAHGGRIWIASRLGEGTTVRFTLPVEYAAHAPEVVAE